MHSQVKSHRVAMSPVFRVDISIPNAVLLRLLCSSGFISLPSDGMRGDDGTVHPFTPLVHGKPSENEQLTHPPLKTVL
jgi:hypothetical protein